MSEDPCTPKEEKQERLSRHKETIQRSQAEDEAHLLAQQRLVYDRSCRALKRRSLIKRHEMEQEQLREVTPVLLTHLWMCFLFTRRPLTSQTKLSREFLLQHQDVCKRAQVGGDLDLNSSLLLPPFYLRRS